jgi:two-component system response regulator AtoC
MTTPATILVVDDEPSMLQYMRQMLEADGHEVTAVGSGGEAAECVQRGLNPDLVFLDVLMPPPDGLQTLHRLRQLRPALTVVMLSCESNPRKVVQAVRMGAVDYLAKPFDKSAIDSILESFVRQPHQGAGAASAANLEALGNDLFFLVASPGMEQLRVQASLVANVDVPVLLLGESGTGKEVVARFIHKHSPRAHRSFMKINCAAVPAELLESELFGYDAGAFTGATQPKPGKFELCNHGTLLLDEIGEMPPALQAKLLHVLQDGSFSRLGGRSSITVDVRILAATNIDVQQAMDQGRLREDLYYRLNAFTLNLPPLRERREEIGILLRFFMRQMAEKYGRTPLPISQGMVDACLAYPWPGNLRELGNFVKRYLIFADESLMISELRGTQASSPPAARSTEPGGLKTLAQSVKDEAESEAISRVLQETNWNRKQAAARLKISYKALLYKIRRYGLAPGRLRASPRSVA